MEMQFNYGGQPVGGKITNCEENESLFFVLIIDFFFSFEIDLLEKVIFKMIVKIIQLNRNVLVKDY